MVWGHRKASPGLFFGGHPEKISFIAAVGQHAFGLERFFTTGDGRDLIPLLSRREGVSCAYLLGPVQVVFGSLQHWCKSLLDDAPPSALLRRLHARARLLQS